MKIEDVMTRRVVAARADTDLAHVARLMWENDCGSVPVVDAEDKVVGMVTDRDACMGAYFNGRSLRELRAAGCMASEMTTCRPEDRCIGAAHWVQFVVDAAGRAALRDREQLALFTLALPSYRHESAPLSDEVRQSLLEDLEMSDRDG